VRGAFEVGPRNRHVVSDIDVAAVVKAAPHDDRAAARRVLAAAGLSIVDDNSPRVVAAFIRSGCHRAAVDPCRTSTAASPIVARFAAFVSLRRLRKLCGRYRF
jgi:hypothetical protein